MRMTSLAAIATGFAAALLIAAPAQARGPLPGSYNNSCQDAYLERGTLYANCKTREGDMVEASLAGATQCQGDIANNDGDLECRRGGGGFNQPGFGDPNGSYQETCVDIEVNGGTLTAQCQDRRGNYRSAELRNYRRCNTDIANLNGQLVCVGQETQNLPSGSWRNTCRNGYVERAVLYAECLTRRGQYNTTRLELSRCGRGEIANDNGVLICASQLDQMPGGSWRNSCVNASVRLGVLYANCRTFAGFNRPTSIVLGSCPRGEIINQDGRLICQSQGGYNPQLPGYGPNGLITLYSDSKYRGYSRTFTRDEPDLAPYNWANVASSLRVQGGVWQLCNGPRYSGRCVTFSSDTVNLSGYFNDQARSLRRVQ